MRKRLTILVSIAGCLVALAPPVTAQPPGRVVAILVADTLDGEIGQSAAVNEGDLKALVNDDLASAGHIPVTLFEVAGKDFSCATMQKILSGGVYRGQKLALASSDAVLFYYAGHGYNAGGTKFPTLICSNLNQIPEPKKDLSLDGVVQKLDKFRPRLVIAIADACNESLFQGEVAQHKGLERPGAEKLQQLFLDYRGTLMFSGSVIGQKSWYPNKRAGVSVFTNQFLTAFHDELTAAANEDRQAKWETIETAATAKVVPSDILPIPAEQQPQSNSNDPNRGLTFCGDTCAMAGAGPARP
jgi:hypothetical protein